MSKRKIKQKFITEFTDSTTNGQSSSKKPKLTGENNIKEKKTKKQVKKGAVEKLPLNRVNTDYSSIDLNCKKFSKDGKPWNFKISSWNIVSLKSLVNKNGMEFVERESPDVMCFQETKCSESKVPPQAKLPGYHTYFASGKKESYAGVGLYSKTKPLNVTFGIGDKEFDTEGRCIVAEFKNFYVVTAYVPNSGRELVTLPKRLKWDVLFRNFLVELNSKKPVILCGDLNVAHTKIDLSNPDTNTRSAGFTQEERDNFSALLNEGFVDTFRNLYPSKTGAYTYWTYLGNARSRNVGWRLDYFVVSKSLSNSVCDSVIRDSVYGSDHCPITLFLAT